MKTTYLGIEYEVSANVVRPFLQRLDNLREVEWNHSGSLFCVIEWEGSLNGIPVYVRLPSGIANGYIRTSPTGTIWSHSPEIPGLIETAQAVAAATVAAHNRQWSGVLPLVPSFLSLDNRPEPETVGNLGFLGNHCFCVVQTQDAAPDKDVLAILRYWLEQPDNREVRQFVRSIQGKQEQYPTATAHLLRLLEQAQAELSR